MNQVNIIGNCGRDPEIARPNDSLTVASVSIAVTEKRKVNGETQSHTEWVNVKAFNKLAELFEKYVKKGDKLRITGKLSTSSWESDGKKQYKTEVIVNDMQFLGSPKKDGSGLPPSDIQPKSDNSNAENDLPF